MKGVSTRLSLAAALTAAITLSACGGTSSANGSGSSNAGASYQFGLLTSSSGPYAAPAAEEVAGVQYAAKLLNDAGGINGAKINLTTVDLQNNPQNAVTQVPKLASNNALAILGPGDSASCEVACVLSNKLKVPLISEAGRGGVLDNARPYAFSMVQPDDANSTPVLAKLVTSKGWKRAAIIVDEATATDKAQGDIYQKVFQQTNVPVVVKATFSAGDSSFAAQISQIKAANPDVLALAAGPDDAGRIAQEARSQGLTATFIGTGSLQAGGPAYYAAGKDATNGTLTATQYDPNNPADPAKSLLAKARADTGKAVVTLNFAYGFDAFNIIAKIIKEKGIKPGDDPAKSRTSIEEALNNLGTYEGMAGKTQLTSQGTAERPQLLSIMQGGQFIVEHSG